MTGEWREKKSKSHPGRVYYYHTATGEKSWNKPEGYQKRKRTSNESGGLTETKKRSKLDSLEEVQALHILVKHSKSRRPTSRRTGLSVTRSKNEAIEILKKLREKFLDEIPEPTKDVQKSWKVFADIAKEHSDCSSFKRGGDLGVFGRKKMDPVFEVCAFHLKVGQIGEVIDTKSGVHIVLRVK